MPPLPEISYDKYDADYESAGSSDLGGAEGVSPNLLVAKGILLKGICQKDGAA